MINERIDFPVYETIGGKKFMAPSASAYHCDIVGQLYTKINNYLLEKRCGFAFIDSLQVNLPDGNSPRPDLVVIKSDNMGIIKDKKTIHGVPDMVVEVLSRSTMKRDLTVKKDSYEKCGVQEYWIINPYMETVEVYLLQDGKYVMDNFYAKYPDYEWENMSDEEKAEAKFEIPVSIFEDLTVKIDDIFRWADF